MTRSLESEPVRADSADRHGIDTSLIDART